MMKLYTHFLYNINKKDGEAMSIGISIYPERSIFEKDKTYVDLAYSYGFRRIFTSLLELTGDSEEVVGGFRKIVQYAGSLGMEVMVDINPNIFKQIGVSYDDLSFFHELGAYGLRLDMGFTGREEAEMTRNPYGLKIEVNMSIGTSYIDNIMSFSPNVRNLSGSHNFYPMRYSGLEEDFFQYCSRQFRNHNLQTAAFVTSQVGDLGPWPVQEGLCTLEDHRYWNIEAQVRYFMLCGLTDDIIIGNAYASESELAAMAEAWNDTHPTLTVELVESISGIEKEIVTEELHSYRGDRSAYLLRSSLPRFKYKNSDIPAHDCRRIKRGDVVIGNNDFGQYKGELHIALKDMENSGRSNVVGCLTEESLRLLPYLRPWSKFKLGENDK